MATITAESTPSERHFLQRRSICMVVLCEFSISLIVPRPLTMRLSQDFFENMATSNNCPLFAQLKGTQCMLPHTIVGYLWNLYHAFGPLLRETIDIDKPRTR